MTFPLLRRLGPLLLFVALIAGGHAWIVNGQAQRASALARDDVRINLPYQLVRPEFTVDGHMWIRFAVGLREGEQGRLRHSALDHAPAGREVHWNSGYAWWLAAAGAGWQAATGLPVRQATEQAAMWANLPLLLGFVGGFALWALRRSGLWASWLVGLSVLLLPNFYEGFWPGYADHHGIASGALLGAVLGALWMRGGWLPRGAPEAEARALAAARWSGVWGGLALWISAATAIPVIALIAVSGLATSWLLLRKLQARAEFCPAIWRAWGRTGAATSVGFYLLEYFPSHLGWRLEVNHPLHALAWLGGAELVATVLATLAPARAAAAPRGAGWRLIIAGAAAVAPAAVVGGWREQVFIPLDPFMAGLHQTIMEFLPTLYRVQQDGPLPHFNTLLVMPLLYLVGAALLRQRGVDRWALLFALGLALPLHALTFLQSRWALSAAPAQVLVLLGVIPALLELRWVAERRVRVVAVAALTLGLIFGPTLYFRARESYVLASQEGITAGDARQLIYREVAQVIRASQPTGEVVLFGSPNTSVNVAFFGDFQSLGTLYWENLAGLQAAARISAAMTEEEAARLIRAHGVTHLAFFRDGNYVLEYARLLRPEISLEEAQQTFAYRLLGARVVPIWLQALPYAAPQGLPAGVDREVLVFKVNFDQTPAQAAYNLGVLQSRRGEVADALLTFAQAFQLDPQHYASALRQGELLIQQQQWPQAQAAFDAALAAAPAEERYRLLTQIGIGFATVGQFTRAVENYERALREPVTNTIAPNNLAWILATARDDRIRQPQRALELARRCVALQPESPPMWGTLAAAQAAAGDFAAATASLVRAIELAQAQRTPGFLPLAEERLAAYRAGQIWLAP